MVVPLKGSRNPTNHLACHSLTATHLRNGLGHSRGALQFRAWPERSWCSFGRLSLTGLNEVRNSANVRNCHALGMFVRTARK
jgi:hypothetical protein